jgi:MFS family permease
MIEEHSNKGIGAIVRKYFVVFVLATTAFTYYYTIQDVLSQITSDPGITYYGKLLIMGAFYVSVGVSITLGALLSGSFIRREKLLYSWLSLSIGCLVLSIIINGATTTTTAIISWIWGISVGLGMPSSMAYFADSTATERRGSVGGVLAFGFIISLFALGVSLGTLAPAQRAQAFMIWLVFSLSVFLLFGRKPSHVGEAQNPKLSSILRDRKLILYLVPWIMFCLVNSLEAPILENFFGSDFFNFSVIVEFTISSVSALVGGFFADRAGRKLVAIVGFALLGVGYAVLGLLPGFEVSRYLYVVVDGIAWGMFVVIFFIVLWGDLGGNMAKDKYYLVGGMPFLLSWLVQLVIEPYVESISIYAAFSLASFLLFLAVLPLLYAPETLPEKRIRERELKGYIEKAKKVKEKYA